MPRSSNIRVALGVVAVAAAGAISAGSISSAVGATSDSGIVRSSATVIVPNVVQLAPAHAGAVVGGAGLVPSFTGSPDGYVASQSPSAGQAVEQGSTVTMRVKRGPGQ